MNTYVFDLQKGILKKYTSIEMSSFIPLIEETLFLQTDYVNGNVTGTRIMTLNSDQEYDKTTRVLRSKQIYLNNESIRKIRCIFDNVESGIYVTITLFTDKQFLNGTQTMSYTINNILTDKWYILPPSYRGLYYELSTNADNFQYFECEITGD
jgi:hypothetical protein